MSKIDSSADVQRAVMFELDQAKSEARAKLKAGPEEIIKALEKMLEDQKKAIAELVKLDFTTTNGQLRSILANELVKVMQNVPGFSQPQLAQPPTPDQLKQLVQTLQTANNQGLLAQNDAVAKTWPDGRADVRQAFGAEVKNNNADAARSGLTTQDSSPLAKNWNSFVQAATSAQGPQESLPLSKDGLREGQAPHELLAKELPNSQKGEPLTAAGLRSPARVGDPFGGLNNKQKLDIMTAAFGKDLALAMKDLGVRDPASLLRMVAKPDAREALANQLGLSRAQLTVHLVRAEMVSIGPGRSGEQALRPQHLPALQQANIVTTSHLATVNALPKEQFSEVFQTVRQNFSGFAKALTGERPILKKDLQHWAKAASRRKSDLLDASWDDMPKKNGDAEEMIMAWYLEHWADLEGEREEKARREVEKERAREIEKQLKLPESKYDPARDDGLICFWIERPNLDWERPTLTEMVYVCLDPRTGLIDMKQKE
jgi:hypothetical protein